MAIINYGQWAGVREAWHVVRGHAHASAGEAIAKRLKLAYMKGEEQLQNTTHVEGWPHRWRLHTRAAVGRNTHSYKHTNYKNRDEVLPTHGRREAGRLTVHGTGTTKRTPLPQSRTSNHIYLEPSGGQGQSAPRCQFEKIARTSSTRPRLETMRTSSMTRVSGRSNHRPNGFGGTCNAWLSAA